MDGKTVKKTVKEGYSKIASGCGCCSCPADEISKSIGYSDEELKIVHDANLGLGCGNPVSMADIKEGDVVLDLGSGAGIDCILASKRTGPSGRVIGVDMTEEMVEKARMITKKHGYKNIEFRLGDIENLPVDDNSVDVIITNCVINLAPDKSRVFREAFRVLRENGRMYISDIVLLKPLKKEQKDDKKLLCGCVAGAMLKDDYIGTIRKAGLRVNILSEDMEISKTQYNGIALESIKIEARKTEKK